MRILVPLNNADHLEDYINAGAEEFYLGFYDDAWVEKFGDYADINRLTGFFKDANPYNLEEVIDLIKKKKCKEHYIYITFNSSLYNDAQLLMVKEYMKRLKEAGADGVIVSCMELVEIAKEVGIFCVISTIAGVYNEDIARSYIRHGAGRMIVPRDLSVEEIRSIKTAVPEAEYEVFMMRNGCAFSDGNCLGMHRQGNKSLCATLQSAATELCMDFHDFWSVHDAEMNHDIFKGAFHSYACGICAIYRFVKMDITACKIVGRSDQWNNICDDIRSIKQDIELAQTCGNEEEYLEKMIFPVVRRESCKMGLNCYYPEIRF